MSGEPTQSKEEHKQVEREERERKRLEKHDLGQLKGQQARGKAERFLTRTTSGVIYAVVTLACLLVSQITTTLLVCVYAWLCCSEFYRMMRMAGRMPNELIGLIASLAFPIASSFSYVWTGAAVYVFVTAVGIRYVLTPRANVSDVAVTIFGPLYTSLLFTAIIYFRGTDSSMLGGVFTFAVMLSIWANDAFAYIVGTRFGKHKLAPKISPNKSWEGFFGGMIGSVLIWVLISVLKLSSLTIPAAIITGIVCGVFGVFGDLFESRIKRSVGVKDSGNLMPGHGGMLDRSDSMLFGCMAAAFVMRMGGFL